jgi:hypothetical protein
MGSDQIFIILFSALAVLDMILISRFAGILRSSSIANVDLVEQMERLGSSSDDSEHSYSDAVLFLLFRKYSSYGDSRLTHAGDAALCSVVLTGLLAVIMLIVLVI